MPRILLSLIVLISLTLPGILPAEDTESAGERNPRHYLINGSIYYPLSINRGPDDSATINLSLLYGKIGRVSGLDLSWAVSVVRGSMTGVQIAGLANVTNGDLAGLQAALLIGQLERLESQTEKRLANAQYLNEQLDKLPGITPQRDGRMKKATRRAYHIYMFRLNPDAAGIFRPAFLPTASP